MNDYSLKPCLHPNVPVLVIRTMPSAKFADIDVIFVPY